MGKKQTQPPTTKSDGIEFKKKYMGSRHKFLCISVLVALKQAVESFWRQKGQWKGEQSG